MADAGTAARSACEGRLIGYGYAQPAGGWDRQSFASSEDLLPLIGALMAEIEPPEDWHGPRSRTGGRTFRRSCCSRDALRRPAHHLLRHRRADRPQPLPPGDFRSALDDGTSGSPIPSSHLDSIPATSRGFIPMSYDTSADEPVADPRPIRPAHAGHPIGRPSNRASTYLALLLVAAVGGAGLFFSGFMLGPTERRRRPAHRTPTRSSSGRSGTRTTMSPPITSARSTPHLLIEGAIKGIFNALGDPYSQYLTEEEYRSAWEDLSGEFEGVGIEMTTLRGRRGVRHDLRTCRLVVTRVIRGSPALAAGIQEGDALLAVDGTSDTSAPTSRPSSPLSAGRRAPQSS